MSVEWNPDITILYLTKSSEQRTIFFTSESNLEITKPRYTVERRMTKGQDDWQNLFAITRFGYIGFLFIYCSITRVKKQHRLLVYTHTLSDISDLSNQG